MKINLVIMNRADVICGLPSGKFNPPLDKEA